MVDCAEGGGEIRGWKREIGFWMEKENDIAARPIYLPPVAC